MKNISQPSINSLFEQALQWTDQGNVHQALKCYEQILHIQPNHAISFNNMGLLLNRLGQYDLALNCFQQASRIDPNYSNAWFNWGNTLKDQNNYSPAIEKYTEAIRCNPNFSGAYNNMGECFGSLDQLDTAIQCYETAIHVNPDVAGTYFNLGNVFYRKYQYKRAIAYYQKSIAIQPDFSDAHYNLSFALLLMGDYVTGFKEYEWRLKRGPFTGDCFSQPFWDGCEVLDKTVFVYSEQGFGDSIHFCRYLTIISQRVGKLILGCRKEQSRLFQTLIGVDQVLVQGDPVPEFDLQCSLLSLPYLIKTDDTSIPCETPYIFPNLAMQPESLGYAIQNISPLKKRIGIVWGGNPDNKNDKFRSIPLKTMAQLFTFPDIQWFSFQKGPQAKDVLPYSGQVIDLSEVFNDFFDTACGLCQMDLLITVDTSVAHLAGALGIPVWLLIPDQPDWRWLLDRSDSPWYPTCLIFRRGHNEDWHPVIDQVKEGLNSIIAQMPAPSVQTYFNHGIDCMGQENETMACLAFQKTLSIYPTMWEAELNLSGLFLKANHCFAAIQYGQRACRRNIHPNVSWHNLGAGYHQCGDISSSIECYQKAKKAAPDDPKINFELAKLFLQEGRWEDGLPLFEYRRFCDHLPKRRQYKLPYWDGKPFKNKNLLLYSDIDAKELILYLRFIPRVKEYGGTVILDAPADMYRLLIDRPGIDRIFYYNDRLDSESETIFDLQLSLQSLPYILGISKDDISFQKPYIKTRKPYLPLLDAIHKHDKQLKVGISWLSGPMSNDAYDNLIETFTPIFQLNDTSFFHIGFKRSNTESQLFPDNVVDLTFCIDDYCDLANAIEQMDIIITQDNSIGHLAGAMCKTVYMILPHVPNWYWSMNLRKSDWYPTIKLFRQTSLSDVQTMVQEISKNMVASLSLTKKQQEKPIRYHDPFDSGSMLVHAPGYMDGVTGYHVHTQSFFNALNRLVPVLETEMQLDRRLKNSIHYLKEEIMPKGTDIINIAIRPIHRLDVLSVCPGIKIGFIVFESNHIPYDWLDSLSFADRLWTPSQWGKKVLIGHGIKQDIIQVIPEGVNSHAFDIKGSRLNYLDDMDAFKFLYVGKFEERKGTESLIVAFDEAFRDNDAVRLILCSHTYTKDFHFQDVLKRLDIRHPQKIIRLGPFARNEDLADLYRSCDAFVMPTRAEGWGLPIIEAMSCGLPVIVTGYSGLTEFATNENAYLVDYTLEDITEPFGLQLESQSTNYGQWARPDMEHLKDLMQYVVAHPDKAKKRGLFASYEIHSKWTWQHAAKKALDAIQLLRH
ncbi:MAG: tetratricopeptide repeat protein [Candidatus Magnetomorum sp.]|nr:tetratricopeptide repeat protein [Candidatus Magnetomorum sp.]